MRYNICTAPDVDGMWDVIAQTTTLDDAIVCAEALSWLVQYGGGVCIIDAMENNPIAEYDTGVQVQRG